MPVAMNESTQQNALQQGLAVGCRALGITEITADWDSVKQSFRRAWLTWDQAHTMPAIRHDLVHSSIRDLTPSPHRRADRRCQQRHVHTARRRAVTMLLRDGLRGPSRGALAG